MAQSGSTAELPSSLQAATALVDKLSKLTTKKNPRDNNWVAHQALKFAWKDFENNGISNKIEKMIAENKNDTSIDPGNPFLAYIRSPELREYAINAIFNLYKNNPFFKQADAVSMIAEVDALLEVQIQLMEFVDAVTKTIKMQTKRVAGDDLMGTLTELLSPSDPEQFQMLSQLMDSNKLQQALVALDKLLLYIPSTPGYLQYYITTIRAPFTHAIACRDTNEFKRTNVYAQHIAMMDQISFTPSLYPMPGKDEILAQVKVMDLLLACDKYLAAHPHNAEQPPPPITAAIEKLRATLVTKESHSQRLTDCEACLKNQIAAGLFPKSSIDKFTASAKQKFGKETPPLDQLAVWLAKEAQAPKKSYLNKISPAIRSIFKPSDKLRQKTATLFAKISRFPRSKGP